MALLPSSFILQSGARYLSLTENIPASLPSGFLKFDEEQIWSPRVKFAAEPAKTGDGRFVHIRSLYNNKYLVTKQIETKSWIVAAAKKPEEDTSKDSCTMFEPYSLADDQPKSVRLRQVQTEHSVTLSSSSYGDAQQGLLASSNSGSVFSVIDRESLVVLPTEISIRSNDHYLHLVTLEGHEYERFEPGLDVAEPRLAKELIPTADGNYRIKDAFSSMLLTRHGKWIWADSPESNTSIDTKFSFVNIENNVFGLRSLGNNRLCGPLSTEGKTNCLAAEYTALLNPTRLTVEERVFKREIFDIKYRLSDARIVSEQPTAGESQIETNQTGSETTATLKFSQNKSRTTSWTNSQTISFGVSVSMTVPIIPVIVEVGIDTRFNYTSTYEWGETETEEIFRETHHSVTVPPYKTYKMTLMATTGVCEVPFSYTQRDLLTDGKWREIEKDDGLFTGVNNFNFYYEIVEVEDTTHGI